MTLFEKRERGETGFTMKRAVTPLGSPRWMITAEGRIDLAEFPSDGIVEQAMDPEFTVASSQSCGPRCRRLTAIRSGLKVAPPEAKAFVQPLWPVSI